MEDGYVGRSRDRADVNHCHTRELLLYFGRADVKIRTQAGETVLHFAAHSTALNFLRTLTGRMSDYNVKVVVDDGRTALDVVVASRNRDAVSVLVDFGCPLVVKVINESLLSWAVDDECLHGIVKMKLIQDVELWGPSSLLNSLAKWDALDIPALYVNPTIIG